MKVLHKLNVLQESNVKTGMSLKNGQIKKAPFTQSIKGAFLLEELKNLGC